ncbi:MAG: hypothetical protein R3C56_35555 [Pirellulaceae bacterium]
MTAMGVGRRDQRPEQQTVQEGNAKADPTQDPVHEASDNRGRDQDTDSGEYKHRPAIAVKLFKVGVQRLGKQQKRKQDIEQHVLKIGRPHPRLNRVERGGFDLRTRRQQKGSSDGYDHQTDDEVTLESGR